MTTAREPANLSKAETLILDLLRKGREMYGLEIVRESAIARGSVYVLLGRLEAKGFVASRQEEKAPFTPGIPRRLYKATKRVKR
jgi:DNA-binding PadR family transcriptional regulator